MGQDGASADVRRAAGKRIGEVWFSSSVDEPLLTKFIFTSERLSIQLHPNDTQARERGLKRGKSECWFILGTEREATLGLGLNREVSEEELRQAALDGSIEQLTDWCPVSAGDFFIVPPGTIHSIGGGISLLEFQQDADVTFRLYDYGRPRELHLDDAVAVARLSRYSDELACHISPSDQSMLVDGPHFRLVHTDRDMLRIGSAGLFRSQERYDPVTRSRGQATASCYSATNARAERKMLIGAKA